jgi:hypothetical protein
VRPDLTADFVKELEVLQKRVLSSILGCASADFTAHKFSQCCLQFGSGGLGMHKYEEVAPAAFCASFIAYIFKTGLAETFEDIVRGGDGSIPSRIASLVASLNLFHVEDDPSIAIEKLFYLKLERYETLQNHLNYVLEDERKEALKNHLETNDLPGLAWFTSLQNSSAGKNSFLVLVPKWKGL